MYKALLGLLFSCLIHLHVSAQELNARVRVVDNQIPTTIDRKIFRTLEASLTTFLNNRKWSADNFKPNEKINCQFLINLEAMPEPNVFSASIIVQAARPVYSSSYVSPIINYKDPNFDFKYIESQPIEFNENRVSGSDPLVSNLTAVMAYYAYIIVGFDYASFSTRGGDVYFQKALNIVNNAPDASKISGWKSFENNNRNRYWLTENLLNNRYAVIHDVYYNYYRKGFDFMIEEEATARAEVINALIYLDNLNKESPNLMVVQFFMLGKADEIVSMFKKASPQDKARVLEIVSRIDITNSNKYKQELR
jgi:Domain of unknown function (DUF4835)